MNCGCLIRGPLLLALLSALCLIPVLLALPLSFSVSAPSVLYPKGSGDLQSKLLIVLPEGVESREYVEVGSRVQRDTSALLSLWVSVGVVSSTEPSKEDIVKAIDDAKKAASMAGFSGTDADTFIAAHGNVGFALSSLLLGDGIFNPYKGILLWGSYIPAPVNSLLNVRSNVLTIGGELDGLVRITRISKEYEKFLKLVSIYGEASIVSRAVVSLPINHAAYTASTLFKDDIKSELSKSDEQALISKISSAFIIGNSDVRGGYAFALAQLTPWVNSTSKFFDGFFKSIEADKGFWCKHSQYMIANFEDSDLDKFILQITQYTEQPPFEQSKSSINTTVNPAIISLHTYSPITPNPSDLPSAKVAPTETMCKTFGQEYLLLNLKLNSSKSEGTCAQVNQAVLGLVLDKYVSPETKDRFQKAGKYISYLPDMMRPSGPEWLGAPLIFQQNPNNRLQYDLASAYLPTSVSSPFAPGVRYCKLLSASQCAEWILVDSLRD